MLLRRNPILLAMILIGSTLAQPAVAQQPQQRTLYQRLGGYDVIAAVVDDFLGRFGSDPQLAPFLGGLNAAAGARVRQHFIDFTCARTGGPCLYNGRDMRATHEGLPIGNDHFDAVVRHFGDALSAQKVGQREREEVLTMLRSLRTEVVSKGGP